MNRKLNRSLFIGLILLNLLIYSSCNKDTGPFILERPEIISPKDTTSYSLVIQPIFDSTCVSCHNADHYTGLDLSKYKSYAMLVKVESINYSPVYRVQPFKPDSSVLWHKIINDDIYGTVMPANGDMLNVDQIKKIKKWIVEGAKNN